MRIEVDAAIEHLRRTGRLAASTPDVHPLFVWPLRLARGSPIPATTTHRTSWISIRITRTWCSTTIAARAATTG
jgi:hypothetical protein